MQIHECDSLSQMLAMADEDFPQTIVAGWMSPDLGLVGAVANSVTIADAATVGKTAAAYAACLSAVLMKLGELLNGNPGLEKPMLQIVRQVVDGMTVAKRFRNEFVTEEVLARIAEIAAARVA